MWQGTEDMIPFSRHFPLFWIQLGQLELGCSQWLFAGSRLQEGTEPVLTCCSPHGLGEQASAGFPSRDCVQGTHCCCSVCWHGRTGRCICWLDLLPPLFCSSPAPSLASLFFPTNFSTGGPQSPALRPLPSPPSSLHAFCCSITYLDNHWCSKTGCTLSRRFKIKECVFPLSSATQSCPTLCDPMDSSMPGLPVHRQLPKLAQTHVHPAIQPSYPLSSPSPPALNLSLWEVTFLWGRDMQTGKSDLTLIR